MAHKIVTHDELENGMLVWKAGVLMRVHNIRKFIEDKGVVVRFNGEILNDDKLKRTAYDMGTYGAWNYIPVAVEIN